MPRLLESSGPDVRFRHDPITGTYTPPVGPPVQESEVAGALAEVVTGAGQRLAVLARLRKNGSLDGASWAGQTAETLRSLHLAAAAAAAGGINSLEPWQEEFAEACADRALGDVTAGLYSAPEPDRCRDLATEALGTYDQMLRATRGQYGDLEERIVGACPNCAEADDPGWVTMGTLIPQEFLRCRGRCGSKREYRQRNAYFAAEDWEVYVGPHGGKGWRNVKTGYIHYGGERPGGGSHPEPAPVAGLFNKIRASGGFTYQPALDNSPTHGMAVSAYQGAEEIHDVGKLSEDDVYNYLVKHADKFADPQTHFGAWHDTASGKVYLDLSKVAGSHEEAEGIARQHNQEGYYDLAAGKTVIVKSAAERRFVPPTGDERISRDAGAPGAAEVELPGRPAGVRAPGDGQTKGPAADVTAGLAAAAKLPFAERGQALRSAHQDVERLRGGGDSAYLASLSKSLERAVAYHDWAESQQPHPAQARGAELYKSESRLPRESYVVERAKLVKALTTVGPGQMRAASQLAALDRKAPESPDPANVEAMHAALAEPTPGKFTASAPTFGGGRVSQNVRDSLNFMGRLFPLTHDVKAVLSEDREYAKSGRVYVSTQTPEAVVAHEIAHTIELKHPELYRLARGFLDSRCGTEPLVSLNSIQSDYGVKEMGRLDDFGKLFPGSATKVSGYYIGREYKKPATEVWSMGVELLHDDPVRFAALDPEYFHLIVNGLKNLGKKS